MVTSKIRKGLEKIVAGTSLALALSAPYPTIAEQSVDLRYPKVSKAEVYSIEHYGDFKADKTVYYVPQIHFVNGEIDDVLREPIRKNQNEIIQVVKEICYKNIPCLTLNEGLSSELKYENLEHMIERRSIKLRKKSPKLSDEEIKKLVMSTIKYDASVYLEYQLKDQIKTLGVENKNLGAIVDEMHDEYLGLLRKVDSLNAKNISKEITEGLDIMERSLDRLMVDERSKVAARKTLELMEQEGQKSASLIYGGGHKESLIEYFGNNVNLYVITLKSYKDAVAKLDELNR